jgi:hypothetical protein
MSNKSNFIFKFLHVIAYIIFIGLCIEAGALIVNFFFSLYKPDIVKNLYEKLDLSDLYSRNEIGYFSMYSFILVISILKAYLFYIVITLISNLDLAKPFNQSVSDKINQISYYTFAIGIISYIAKQSTIYLSHRGFEIDKLNQYWADSQAFILMAAVIYIIATIFSKGVEIQNENDLTV